MEILVNLWWLWPILFLISLIYILRAKKKAKEQVSAQFVITGCLLFIFYCVCFMSGVCTILNFLWKWVL